MPNGAVGEKLRDARLKAGLSQGLVARKLGATRQMVSAWERNIARPRMVHLLMACALYGCTPCDIAGVDLAAADRTEERSGEDQLLAKILARPGAADPYKGITHSKPV